MKNCSNLLFIFCLLISTFICVSSNSWLGAWIGLEMNLLSFIPLMNNNNNSLSNEASLKYFLIQALASILILFFICINFIKLNFFSPILFNQFFLILINSALLLKLGAAPFHFWFPSIMDKLSWFNNMILMTWQKINPFICISYSFNNKFIFIIALLSIVIGALGGFSSSSIRKILAYSSINHIGWMLISICTSELTFWFYFMFYTFISISLIYILNKHKLFFINQFLTNSLSNFKKILISITFLSMGGLPPFMGFIPKWLIIDKLVSYNMFFLMIIMVLFSLITLYFYLRMVFSMLILNNMQMYWKYQNNTQINYFMMISTLGYPLLFYMFMI